MNFIEDVYVEKVQGGYINSVTGIMSFEVVISLNIIDYSFPKINEMLNKFIISKEEFNKTFHGERIPSTVSYFRRKKGYFTDKELMFKYFKGEI